MQLIQHQVIVKKLINIRIFFQYLALKTHFMKKKYFYEPLPIPKNIFMEYVCRLIQYFYRIQFYE